MEQGRKVIFNTLSQVFNRGLVVFASVLTTAVLTRSLGTSAFGNYVFITSFVLIFVGLSDLGTSVIGVREASFQKERKYEIFSNILGLRLLFSFLIFVVYNFLVFNLPQFAGLRIPSFISSFVFPFLVLRTTFQAVLQTYLRLDLSSFLEVIASVFSLGLLGVFIFLKNGLSLEVIMVFWLASAIVSSIAGYFISKRFLKINISFDKSVISDLFKNSIPLGLYLMIYSIYDKGIDSFLLKTFSTSEAVGYYGLAYKIYGNLIFGAAFLMNSLFPIISSLKGEKEKLSKLFKKTFSILLLAGMLVVIFGNIFSPLVVNIISGSTFQVSSVILRILVFAALVSFLNHMTGFLMIALNEQKYLLLFSVVSLMTNLILNVIFIPLFSFWAAAIITVITEATILILTTGFLRRRHGLTFTLKDFKDNLLQLITKKERFFNND